jgi:hypothetical protein
MGIYFNFISFVNHPNRGFSQKNRRDFKRIAEFYGNSNISKNSNNYILEKPAVSCILILAGIPCHSKNN